MNEEPTLLDFFASLMADEPGDADYTNAVKEALVGRSHPGNSKGPLAILEFDAEWRAKWRYMRADAMLRARGGPLQ